MSKVEQLTRLRRWQAASAVLFAGLALAAGIMMTNNSYQLVLGHWAKDDFASQQSAALAPAVHPVFDVEARWMGVGVLAISAILPLLYVSRLEVNYERALRVKVLPWRWIDLGVTGALMVQLIAVLSGVQELMLVKLAGDAVLIAALLGWLAERQNTGAGRPVWSAYLIGLFSGVLPWFVIGGAAVSTVLFGFVRTSWYVYALYASTLIGFGLIALNQYKQLRRQKRWKDYLFTERNYVVINLLTKVAFGVILIIGLQR